MARVFVTGTGRCGTTTFFHAAAHATNFTVGHESKAGRVGDWDYPDNHIEVSAQLVIAIPLLQEKYPDAKWVHLIRRDRDACVHSLSQMPEVMAAVSLVFFQVRQPDPIQVAEVIYDTLNHLCRACLGSERFEIGLEAASAMWRSCWRFMGCEGDYQASLAEWMIRYNASHVVEETTT